LRGSSLDQVFSREADESPANCDLRGRSAGRPLSPTVKSDLRGREAGRPLSPTVNWRDVAAELADRLAVLPVAARARTWVDPGIGFGKGADPAVNLALLRHAGDLGRALGCRVVVGPSRKRFLRTLIADDAGSSLDVASVAACLAAVQHGAQVLRIHNVALLRAALAVYTKV
ncbi:MAG: dihydropteroate synthase, partial [Myxococcota bacterium]|nr:dihydropteroate synthase [Myxococcota bacterium]